MQCTGTWMRSEHAAEEAGTDYRHLQRLVPIQLELSVRRGLGRGLGLELLAPLRLLRTRIRFEDAARRPFEPAEGEIHHRDETLLGLGDPWLSVQAGRSLGSWSGGLRAGLSLPLGRTEEDPFALGERGLRHQHVQFGTGTWDPVFGAGLERRLGRVQLALTGGARLSVAENGKGYRAGHRFQGGAAAARGLAGTWSVRATLDLLREQAERWHGGHEEEEGNLGRTDVLAGLGVSRGAWSLGVRIPVLTRVGGSQLDYPLLLSLGWTR